MTEKESADFTRWIEYRTRLQRTVYVVLSKHLVVPGGEDLAEHLGASPTDPAEVLSKLREWNPQQHGFSVDVTVLQYEEDGTESHVFRIRRHIPLMQG